MRPFLYTGTYYDQYGQPRTFHRPISHIGTPMRFSRM